MSQKIPDLVSVVILSLTWKKHEQAVLVCHKKFLKLHWVDSQHALQCGCPGHNLIMQGAHPVLTWFLAASRFKEAGSSKNRLDPPVPRIQMEINEIQNGHCRIWRSLVFKWLLRVRCDPISEQLNSHTWLQGAFTDCVKWNLQLAIALAAHSLSASWHLNIQLLREDTKAFLATLMLGDTSTEVSLRKILKIYVHLLTSDLWNYKIV